MYLLFILSALISVPAFADGTVQLTEGYIKDLLLQKPPSVQQIEASFLATKYDQLKKEEGVGFRLDAEGAISRSDEKLLSQFDGGVTASSTSYSVGIIKPTRYGVDLGLKAFGQKVTNSFLSDGATNGVAVSLSIDLYQNFLGRNTNSGLKKGALAVKRAELEKKSSLKNFESNIRKLYWSLVANNERHKLLSSLAKTAEKQYKTARRKRKSGAADAGEVARFHSQWSSRQSDVLSLNYKKGSILKSLKELIPSLNGKEIILGKYSVPETISKVLACTQVIDSYKKAPFQNTVYDEIVELLEKEEKLSKKMTSFSGGPSVKLVGEYASIGRGIGFGQSRDDFNHNAEARTNIGLMVSMPLGKEKIRSKKVLEELNKSRYQAEARQNLSKINAYHSETVRLVRTLREVLKSQRETNKYLEQSLRSSRRKYRQARISLQELIGEQDAHLQSKLKEIDSNIAIINTLMDYFSIYMDVPCAFNKI